MVSKLLLVLFSLFEEGKVSDGVIHVDKDDDEKIFSALIKYFYTGSVDYTDEADLISFIKLSHKYKAKNFKDLKFSAKSLLLAVFAYVEKDTTNRVDEFPYLTENVNFKKIDKEDLLKYWQKKKWLQQVNSYLNVLISKDIEDDEESEEEKSDSESGSGSGSDSSSSEEDKKKKKKKN